MAIRTRTKSRALPLPIQRAAAGGTLPRGAAVAMVAHRDVVPLKLALDEVGEAGAPLIFLEYERQAEHLVEVAVVHITLPVDGDEVAAHHRLQVLIAVRA